MAGRAPGAHVLRLLLRPHDLLERRVRRDQLPRRLDRERVQLLEPRDRDAFGVLVRLVADDVVVDLSRAENEPADRRLVRHRRIVE